MLQALMKGSCNTARHALVNYLFDGDGDFFSSWSFGTSKGSTGAVSAFLRAARKGISALLSASEKGVSPA